MLATTGIRDRLARIEERIGSSCQRAGRDRREVTLIGVSKTFPTELIAEGIDAGLRVLGENRVQEAATKIPALSELCAASGVVWHLIGHLQSNKVRRAVELFSMIHSVDSLKLAERIDAVCGETGRQLPILIEVNLGGEESKAGVKATETLALCEQIGKLPNLQLQGLMTVPPFAEAPEDTRPYFRELRALRDQAVSLGLVSPAFTHLSMGMSHDFEVAIEEGATMVRVGTAIFGSRG
jgi:pyridoxal phosphate enzyme (YggS family)